MEVDLPSINCTKNIPSAGVFRPIFIDKSYPIELMGSSLLEFMRTFNSSVRARSTSRRTSPAEGIERLALLGGGGS